MPNIAIIGFGAAGYAAAKALREAGYSEAIHVFTDSGEPTGPPAAPHPSGAPSLGTLGGLRDASSSGCSASPQRSAGAELGASPQNAQHFALSQPSPDGPANPMLTTYYVAGKIPYEQMFPFGDLPTIAGALNLTLHSGKRVTRLNAAARTVEVMDIAAETGEAETHGPYQAVLCATGARPFTPPLAHCPDQSCLYTMRTVADARRLRARLEGENPPSSALVIGASMVGIKVAELLANAGVETTMADLADRIFPLAAMPDIAELIHQRVQARGVSLLFGHTLKEVAPRGQAGYTARLEGPGGAMRELKADIVCLCIGTRPNLDYIDPEELPTRPGLIVDETMQTAVPGVYAAGDCAAGANLQLGQPALIGLWQNALLQGRAAGLAMAGKPEPYAGNIFHNITHFMDMDFISFGNICQGGEVITDGGPEKGFELRAVMCGDELACVNILDNVAVSGPIRSYMVKRFLEASAPDPSNGRYAAYPSGAPLRGTPRETPGASCLSASRPSQLSALSAPQAGLLQKCGLRPETIRRLEGSL